CRLRRCGRFGVSDTDVPFLDLLAHELLVGLQRLVWRLELLGLRLAGGAQATELDGVFLALKLDGPELFRGPLDQMVLAPRNVFAEDNAQVGIVVLDREACELFQMVADGHGRMLSAGAMGMG